MRLLHTQTLDFQEFEGANVPKYAILSHRWSNSEISYKQHCDGNYRSSPDYAKISELCRVARHRGLDWAWTDTCCIDKSSSAELTESINSMWSYYRGCAECYVYLADVPSWIQKSPPGIVNACTQARQLSITAFDAFRSSDWFNRGWTLQELLAPSKVLFYTTSWKLIGSKEDLASDLALVTGVPVPFLTNPDLVKGASIAMRMSWASHRQTTRLEDTAYCLLGLFDVNMPLLYGEGTRAFMRLQRKIVKRFDDESIFAWELPVVNGYRALSGMLATSPAAFASSGNVIRLNDPVERRLQYQITNRGLELRIPRTVRSHARQKFLNKLAMGRVALGVVEYKSYRSAPSETSSSSSDHDSLDDNDDDDDSEDDNSASDGAGHNARPSNAPVSRQGGRVYTELSTKLPNSKIRKKFQLACGRVQTTDSSSSITTEELGVARRNIISITLVRTLDGDWQRQDCNKLEVWSEYVKKDAFSRSLYYVPQEGL